ncbi:MAG: hypothetical protein HWE25_17130 [Alphaproteobacteria bacterium]|nr:hypothetical protein [Alphaproteobacteria bacterium]
MMNKTTAALCLLLGTASQSVSAANWRDQVNMSSADLGTFTMTLIQNGEKAGFMTYGWAQENGHYVVRDRTEMQPNIVETAEAWLDGESLLPKSVAIDFAIGENSMDIDLKWLNGWRKGAFVTVRSGERSVRDIDLQEDTIAPLRMAVIGFIAALPLDEEFQTGFTWFNTLANRGEEITISVRGSTETETPAGTFDTWIVDLKGGSPENVLYVTKSLPRKITRIDVVGQPMHFELAAD